MHKIRGEKERDLTQSHDKSPYPKRAAAKNKAKGRRRHRKVSISQLLRANLERSIEVTTVTQLVELTG